MATDLFPGDRVRCTAPDLSLPNADELRGEMGTVTYSTDDGWEFDVRFDKSNLWLTMTRAEVTLVRSMDLETVTEEVIRLARFVTSNDRTEPGDGFTDLRAALERLDTLRRTPT